MKPVRGPYTLDGGEPKCRAPRYAESSSYTIGKPTPQQNDSCSIFRTSLGRHQTSKACLMTRFCPLTGDNSGYTVGKGFLKQLERAPKHGWAIEVINGMKAASLPSPIRREKWLIPFLGASLQSGYVHKQQT